MIISVGRNLTTLKKDRKSALIVLKCVNISLHRYPKKKERKKEKGKKNQTNARNRTWYKQPKLLF